MRTAYEVTPELDTALHGGATATAAIAAPAPQAPPADVLARAQDAVSNGAPAEAVLARMRTQYEVSAEIEAALRQGRPLVGSAPSARPETSTLSNLGAGALGSIAGADRLAANALDLVGIDSGAEYMRGRAANIEANAAPLADDTLGGVVAQAVGGAPVGVLEAVAAASLGGPVAGFAGLGALSEADKGWMAAAKAALEGGAVGKATKLLGNLPAALRVPAFAALFGGQSLFDTGDQKQAVAGAVTGAGLALPGVLPGRRAAERPRVEPAPLEPIPRAPLSGDATGVQLASGETRRGPFTVEQAAEEALNGPRHRVRSDLFRAVDETIFGAEHPMETAAVGVTASYGTEASMVTRYADVPADAMKASAALKGYLANQLSVLTFREHAGGASRLYEISIPEGIQPGQVTAKLHELGVEYSTPELRADGTVKNLLVVEPTQGTVAPALKAFAQWAGSTDTLVSEGTGELLGSGQSRKTAREVFRNVLEERRAVVGGPDVVREAVTAFRRRVQATDGGGRNPRSPQDQAGARTGDAGPGSGSTAADGRGGRGPAGAGGSGAPAPPLGAYPGRGSRVDVADPSPRFDYNPSVLGPAERSFVERVLTDPVGAAQQEVARRGTMSRGQVADLSERFPLTFEEALALPQGTVLPVEGQQRLAEYGKRAIAGVHEAAAEVQNAARAGDAVGEAAARAVLDARSAEAGRLIMAFEAQGSEVGRALGIRAQGGISATHAELLARRALRMVMDEQTLSSAQRDAMAGRIVAAGSDPAKIVAAVRDAYTPGWWEKLQELRVNFLIANPPTVVRNIVGNGVGVASRLVENAVGIPIDLAYSAGQKVGVLPRGPATEPNRARAREMGFDIFGTLQGTLDGLKLAARSLTNEDFALTQGRVGAEVSRLPAIGGRTGQVVRIGTRIQSAADLLFRAINETGELYRQAARQAYAERQSGPGYTGRVRELVAEAKAVDPLVKQRIAEGKINAKTDAERIAAAGHNVGLEFTYQLPLGEFARKIDRARSSDTLGGHVAKTLVPFFRTPLNLGKFVAQRAPVTGWFSPRNLAEIRSGNRDLVVQSMARIATGTAISTGLLALAQNGLISGAPPDDLAAREAAKRSGWRPWSIKVQGEWLDYRGYSPISEQLAIVAGIAKRLERPNGWREADATDLLRVGTSIARTMVDQPYFTGFADVVDLLTQTGEERQERGLVRFTGQLASGLMIPRVVAWLARSTDPLERAPADTVGDRISLDVPGERENAPAWRDPLGRAYETPDGALGAFVRHSSDGPASPLDAWLFAIHESPDKAVVGYPSRTQLGRRLSAADWERFMVARGELLIPVLEQIRQATKAKGADTAFAARAAIAGVVPKIQNLAEERVLPDAELRALGIEPTSQARLAVLAVMRTAPVRALYEAKGRTEDEKRQILELVTAGLAGDPRAGVALRQMITGPSAPAQGSALQLPP